MRKRLLSFVLAVLMIVCLFPVQQASAYSDAYSLPSLTGNQAVDTANIAKSQLGYTYDGGTVYGAWWNGVTNWGVDYTQAGWCAIFVCWCANKAGAGLGIAYDKNGASPGYLFDWLKNNARYDTSFQQHLRLAILFSLATVAAESSMWQLLQSMMRPLAVFIW